MSFSLQFGESAPVPASLFAKPVLKLRSGAVDTLDFAADGAAMDTDALAAERSIVSLLNGSTPMFCGRLFRIPRAGSGSEESVSYQVRGPWSDFERIVYQQLWYGGVYISEYILGMNAEGVGLTNGGAIADAVTYAISAGANCQLGTISVSAPIIYDQKSNLTVAEIIHEMMRWSPGAVAWFDYTTVNGDGFPLPTFNVTRKASCATVALPFTGSVEQQNIHPMPELNPPAVIINYLSVATSNDGPSQLTITPDIYPPAATTNPPAMDTIAQTVRLAGASSTYQRQPVTIRAIPIDNSAGEGSGHPSGPSDDPSILFWQRKDPTLKQFDGENLLVTNIYGTYQVGQGDDDGSGLIAVNFSTGGYPNELINGSFQEWMTAVQWAKINMSALVAYTYPSYPPDDTWEDADFAALDKFGPPSGSGVGGDLTSGQVYTACSLTSTNATTQVYTNLSSYTAAETPPTGLAEYIFNSCAVLMYEGDYKMTGQDCAPASLGIVVNLTGGRTEWSTMQALVQTIEQDLENGSTSYHFGAYGHLTIQDLLERIRASRTHSTAKYAGERVTGNSSTDTVPLDGADQSPSDGGSSRQLGRPPWLGDNPGYKAGSGYGLTWQAALGFGQASFIDGSQFHHPQPLEGFELNVGNDQADWDAATSAQMSGLNNVLSLVSGDSDYGNDRIWTGAISSDESDGGCAMISPGDPSLIMAGNGTLDPGTIGGNIGDDLGGIPIVQLDLSEMLLGMQDEDGSFCTFNMGSDAGGTGAPMLQLSESGGSAVVAQADSGDTYLNLNDQSGSYIDLDASGAIITLSNESTGAEVDIDTADIDGDTATFNDWSGDGLYVLSTGDQSDFEAAVNSLIESYLSGCTVSGSCSGGSLTGSITHS